MQRYGAVTFFGKTRREGTVGVSPRFSEKHSRRAAPG